eukprot:GHVU01134111.1.p1 GENE.GHVU01134111.1~~GHVU01134111.1.p1  ORF type:complete len:456 (-),score=15.22 GHVU01134111.1:231-1535(-)
MISSREVRPIEKYVSSENIKIILVTGMYCLASIGLVFVNRITFTHVFPYPVFVSWWQQVVGLTLFRIFARIGRSVPLFSFFPEVTFEGPLLIKTIPLSVSFVLMVGLANVTLKFIQVSTYQVARSLTLLFNLILSILILKTRVSARCWIACAIVIAGFIVGGLDTSTMSLIGLVFGGLSSLCQAYYNVTIKNSMSLFDGDANKLLCYNLFISSFLFIPFIFICGEGASFAHLPFELGDPRTMRIWGCLMGSGVLGISLTGVIYHVINLTGPVSFNIVGYAKACVQSLGGIVVLHEPYTLQSISGIGLTLFGSFYYSRIKYQEGKEESKDEKRERDESGDRKLQKFGDDHHSVIGKESLTLTPDSGRDSLTSSDQHGASVASDVEIDPFDSDNDQGASGLHQRIDFGQPSSFEVQPQQKHVSVTIRPQSFSERVS